MLVPVSTLICHALDGVLESVEDDAGVLQLVHIYVGSAAVGEQRGAGGEDALVRLGHLHASMQHRSKSAAGVHATWARTLHLARVAAGSGACREDDEPVQRCFRR